MKTLLAALKLTLITNISWLCDIEIVPLVEFVPQEGVRYPFIGLKDGQIVRAEGHSSTLDEELTVNIMLWQELHKREASIMGDGDAPGILEMAVDVHELLNENLLGLPGMIRAFCRQEDESAILHSPDGSLVAQMKRLVYVYERTT